MNANEEDSSGESDDDIVLDQSLATTHQTVPLTSHILTHNQIHSNPVQIQQKQQKQAIIVNNKPKSIVTPTIVTICPPTLKSNKNNNNINIKKIDNNNNNKKDENAISALPPPIPFHGELKTPSTTATTTTTTTTTATTLTTNTKQQITRNRILQNENLSDDNNEEEIIGPRVDPKLLKLMNLNDKNNTTFFDLDLDELTDKPWNHKSVDITDWFNYGFNEQSWRKYCNTQIKMRNILKKQQIQQINTNIINHQQHQQH
eukprot:303192_1